MKHGIYYAYWEHSWDGDYIRYVRKAAELGFDILEIAATPLPGYSDAQLSELRRTAEDCGVRLTVGHGPHADQNVGARDPAARRSALAFWESLYSAMEKLGADKVGGAVYSYWPVDFSSPINKAADRESAVLGMRESAKLAARHGVTLCCEVLNRFEGYLLNTAEEGVGFVRDVGEPNVKVMLDTFHMNIEEDSIGGAIRSARGLLGHFHTGECNRRVPGKGRTPWREIGEALKDIGYDGDVVMEPFVMSGGKVGQDIKVWRDLSRGASESELDADAKAALAFSRYMLG